MTIFANNTFAEKIMPRTKESGFATTSTLPLIELKGVQICNEGNLILDNVTFSVRGGELIYLVGKVGSGKTSLLKSIIAQLPVTKGSIRVGDYDLTKIRRSRIPYLRRNIGVVFQDFQLLADRTVMENLEFVLKATDWEGERKRRQRCEEVLEMVALASKANKRPHQLSGGEQQRVAIARAILNSPSIILADEPTGNLDGETTRSIMNLLMKIHNQYRPAIIIITHNRALIENYPGRVLLCGGGEVKEITEQAVVQQPL